MKRADARRRIRKGRTAEDRRSARKGISLRAMGISSGTERRYLSAVALVLPLLESCVQLSDLDIICEEWIELQWERGTPLGIIGDALSGLHFFWPQVKGWLRGSWRLFKNWRKIEAPQRAPPLPLRTCKALVGVFLDIDQVTLAFLIGLGFHAYLRTGELLRLTFRDIHASKTQGVVTVRASKAGLRFNIDEAVTITDHTLLLMWQVLIQNKPEGDSFIWPRGARAFRAAFHDGLAILGLSQAGYQPYSLRRGGATHHYMIRRNLDGILLRGRWRSLAVGRLYLEDGLATLHAIHHSAQTLRLVDRFSSGFPPHFLL